MVQTRVLFWEVLALHEPRVLKALSILIVILLLILIDKGFAPSGAACDERGEIRITITIKSRRSRVSTVHGPNLRPMLEVFPLHEPGVLKAHGFLIVFLLLILIPAC